METPRPGPTEGVAASPPRHTYTRKGLAPDVQRSRCVHRSLNVAMDWYDATVSTGTDSRQRLRAQWSARLQWGALLHPDHRVASESEAVLRPARQLCRGPGAHHAVIGECEARFLLVGQLPRIAFGDPRVGSIARTRLFNLWGHINLP